MVWMIQSALENGTFPNYFSWDINILEGNSIDSMQQTARYLKQIIDRNEFHTLLWHRSSVTDIIVMNLG